VTGGTDFNANPEPIGAEEEARQMPLSFDDGGESLSLPTATRRRRPGVGAVVFAVVAVGAAASLLSMRAIGRAGAAENASSEAGKLVETFLKERSQAKAGKDDAKLDLLDTDGVTALQIAKEDLRKDPFVLAGEIGLMAGGSEAAPTGGVPTVASEPAPDRTEALKLAWEYSVDEGAAGILVQSCLLSSNPANSMAHVNGQVLRMGDAIAVPNTTVIYEITEIGADGIVLRAENADLSHERLVRVLVRRN
jgi:hypothetical protein